MTTVTILMTANTDMGWLRSGGSMEIIGLFCRTSSLLLGSFAKEPYNFIDPTNQSHPI